jgi:Holliday junction resolvase RusA-like endonuclease
MYREFKELNIEKFYTYVQKVEMENYVTGDNLYRTGYNFSKGKSQIYKNPEAKAFQEEIQWKIECIPDDIANQVYCYEMTLGLGANWFTKEKKLKKLDLSNLLKTIEDAIAKKIEIDDSLCFKHILQKLIPTKEMNKGSMDILIEINFYRLLNKTLK